MSKRDIASTVIFIGVPIVAFSLGEPFAVKFMAIIYCVAGLVVLRSRNKWLKYATNMAAIGAILKLWADT